MVSKAKLYAKLDNLEMELLANLIPHLRSAADGRNDLVFCVTAFNPFREFKHRTDPLTEELVEIGSQILVLNQKLGEPSVGTPAERLCWYCREWANTHNSHPHSAQRLAGKFLIEINALEHLRAY